MTATDELLRATAAAWDRAMLTNDADAIAPYVADDWQIIGADGGITDRATFLALIRDGRLTHDVMTTEDPQVQLVGAVGIVIAHGISAGRFDGRPFRVLERQSNVFVHQEGGWRCLLTHLSPMPDVASAPP